jgi:molybdopterin biosynthesis enzyme
LTLAHVGGAFVVLLGGCAMSCIMVFFEFMWKARKLARDDDSVITPVCTCANNTNIITTAA